MDDGRQPIRVIVMIWAWTVLVGFVVAFSRDLSPSETSSTVRTIIRFGTYAAVALVAADGLRSAGDVRRFLNRFLNLGAFMAAIGAIQFFTSYDPTTRISIPGLQLNGELIGVNARSVVDRVAGTASHPIEFGVVAALLLPLALHVAFHAPKERAVWVWVRVGLFAAVVPMSVSRSAVLTLLVAGIIAARSWPWRRRINMAIIGGMFLVLMRTAVPGLLGTIRSLFVNAGNDPSVQGRTEDIDPVFELISQRPVFGRGLGTFIPSEYFVLDNQYLMTVLEMGIVGLIGFLILFFGSAAVARQVFWRRREVPAGDLGNALAASIVAALVSYGTFDGFSFRLSTGFVFILIGLAGALWRVEVRDQGA